MITSRVLWLLISSSSLDQFALVSSLICSADPALASKLDPIDALTEMLNFTQLEHGNPPSDINPLALLKPVP
jgi:hypothetical protein